MPEPADSRYDVVIVGGGHNGLVCAALLARKRLRVCVLERRAVVGGAAVTEVFHPGFRNSVASYTVSLLHPQVIEALALHRHGLRIVERPLANFLPLPQGGSFRLGGGLEATQREVARWSERDAQQLPAYAAMLDRAVTVLRELNVRTPPALGEAARAGDWRAGLDAALRFKRLDTPTRRDLLDLFTISAGDLLDRWFDSDPLKAALGWDAVVGNYASPYAPGSAYVLLHHVFGEVNGQRGAWGHAIGGMGAITQAMARACEEAGVTLITDAEVAQIAIDEHKGRKRAAGVVLTDGRVFGARAIAANVGPKVLFSTLIDPAVCAMQPALLDARNRIAAMKTGSASFRINVALAELPDFTSAPGSQPQAHHGAGILFAPSLAYMERAYFDARTHGWSHQPIVELNIASVLDDTLVDPTQAPPGAHVASIFCQHFDPRLRERWDEHRDAAVAHIVDVIDACAPNFARSILGLKAYSPMDLERTFNLVDGDIFHGALQLNQLWAARPVLGHGNYRMPIHGLYLCGSGAHPGGGVTGVPGMNAAREIAIDFARRRLD